MGAVKEIEKAVSALPPEELAKFRKWFEAFDAAMWDKQVEEDARSGRLDRVADGAVEEYQKGKAKPL